MGLLVSHACGQNVEKKQALHATVQKTAKNRTDLRIKPKFAMKQHNK